MRRFVIFKTVLFVSLASAIVLTCLNSSYAESKEAKREKELQELQKRFEWWPTDATPGPIKDEEKGGYWWWPSKPGTATPWGNRGYIYVYKIIFDYKEEELPAPKPQELRPSLLIKKIIKNVKIYFDYDKADLRSDHIPILENAVRTLKKNPEADILITGNCDRRGSEEYNLQLGKKRGDVVKQFMIDKGIDVERVRIVSRGKLDAVAPVSDIIGMQKDRNAQFMVAEVEEVMIPYPGEVEEREPEAVQIEEGKYIVEEDKEVESQVKVSTKQYVIKKNDSLSKIAQEQLGNSHRWKYLYEFNKDRIKDPNKLVVGTIIIIPIEQGVQGAEIESEPVIEKSFEAETEETYRSEPVAAAPQSYVIKKNDSLWKIAQQKLGDGNRWKEIYELNKEKIKDPNKLKAGTTILVPVQ